MPHITEELFGILYSNNNTSIHSRSSWPDVIDVKFENIDINGSETLLEILELVRKIKAQDNLSIKAPIELIEVKKASFLSDSEGSSANSSGLSLADEKILFQKPKLSELDPSLRSRLTPLSANLISDLKNVTSTKEIKFVAELSADKQALVGEKVAINVVY